MPSSVSSVSSTASSDVTSNRVRQLSETSQGSSVSYSTAKATGTSYDGVSLATTSNTGFTQGSNMQSIGSSGSIPIIAAPTFQSQQRGVQVNVSSAHHQQQNFAPSEISPSSASTVSTSGQSRSVYVGNSSQANGNYQRTSTYASTYAPSQAYTSYESAQYAQPSSMSQFDDFSYGGNASMDSMLHIDYGAIDAYNYGMQAPEVMPPVPKQAKQQRFDVAKSIFNQVDTNHDGSISRDEFNQWAQRGQQETTQTFPTNYQNVQQSSFVNTSDSNLDITSIIQQSGLGQTTSNWR